MAGRLEGRIALVSGGLRGIGRAISECLGADGAMVYVTDLDPEDSADATAIAAALTGARYLRLDATSEEAWAAARARVEQDFGHLDILVNNVGADLTGKVQDLKLEDWRRLITLNLDTVFLGTKTFQPLLAKGGASTPYGSSIINISSIMGLVGMGEVAAYNASKGGVRLFSKSNALEFAEAGVPIRVNSVHPGFVDTPLLRQGFERWAAREGTTADAMIDAMAQTTPIKRLARPVEIGKVVAFLASDDASYMTGSEVVVDGGWTAR
ncbi:NAD(P)-dependent dehydrogenase (short-subunit alcohol dehydrogenase family) [Sphingobium fontiphilum]|uniref:NAD(P)-dependent dehydrogenase (Short-subunit alcohol dehydrogenase family) n=1 Tax=Sphingobium fontiphilum TaxID=944425 RepID=A0A7W6GN81_9SPHN|nr:SDR family oxidoreductase [Sphingobium fontiphilum]MBB3981033.1 NAD(P)-dependent dehydrogenase (short-subunit alcohol dehydrogenase family) [Sphingobium fontiphilum]